MAPEEEKSNLEELKATYSKIQKKYDLPSFKEMNEDFHIEKISEIETDLLMGEIRKFVGDKLANYLRFVENLLNPVNVPMFIFSVVKVLDANNKKTLEEVYKGLIKIELGFIELDIEYDEGKEAKFIKESYNMWQNMKKDLMSIMNKINSKLDEKSENNSKGYFG